MNFLGHLLLTYPHRELTMGNLLGDLVRRRHARHLSQGILQGIELHHKIDSYTDQHPDVRELTNILRPTHAKYAPVVVDILLDHVLARQWNSHADIGYPEFTEWVYKLVPDFLSDLNDPVVVRLEGMVRHRWLDDYDSVDKLHAVLLRMDRRARFPSQFVHGSLDIAKHYDLFASTFETFYHAMKKTLFHEVSTSQGRD